MPDDLGSLRRAMGDLAEHGGNADLYERSLAKSRRLRRRTTVMIIGVAAVAVLGVGVGITAVNGARPQPLPVAGPSASVSPSMSPPPSDPPQSHSATPSASVSAASSAPVDDGCPVRASTLQQVADLPDGWRITASTVKCWRGWASAGLTPPSPDIKGDGIILFRYDPDHGWREYGQGSGFDCADLGIEKTSGEQPPFCTYHVIR